MKICKICGQEKPLADFYKHPLIKDGHDNRCKQCMADQQRERIKKNPGKHSACVKQWMKKNPEKMKGYRDKRKDKHKIYMKEWVAKNPDKVKAKQDKYRTVSRDKYIAARSRMYVKRKVTGKAAEAKKRYKTVSREKYLVTVKRQNEKRWANPKYRFSMLFSRRITSSLHCGKSGRHWETLVGYSAEDLKHHIEAQFKPGMSWKNRSEWHIDHIRPIASFDFTSPDDPGFMECWALGNLQPLWAKENMAKGARYEN